MTNDQRLADLTDWQRDNLRYRFHWHTRDGDSDFEGSVTAVYGDFLLHWPEDEEEGASGDYINIGMSTRHIFHVDQDGSRPPLHLVMDEFGPFTSDLYDAMFTRNQRPRRALLNALNRNDVSFRNIHYAARTFIRSKHQGRNLGLLALCSYAKTFVGDSDALTMLPGPLDAPKMKHEELLVARNKLRAYWSRFGMRRIGSSDYYVLPMEMQRPQPYQFCERGEHGELRVQGGPEGCCVTESRKIATLGRASFRVAVEAAFAQEPRL